MVTAPSTLKGNQSSWLRLTNTWESFLAILPTVIAAVLLKASQRMCLLCFRARNLRRDLITVQLYLSYARQCMEYASPVWHFGLTCSELTTLERLQARMARTILQVPWNTPKSVMLATLEWPSLRWRRAVECRSLFHRLMTVKLTAGFFFASIYFTRMAR